jgi:WhiB family redox-sensing transcriptional regulator
LLSPLCRLCKQPLIGRNSLHPGDVVLRTTVQKRKEGRPEGPEGVATHSWEYGWQWRAACRGEDSGLFFPPGEFEPKEERVARERKAKAICATCPVRVECLDYAIRIHEPHGIWGGLNELERRVLMNRAERPSLRSIG